MLNKSKSPKSPKASNGKVTTMPVKPGKNKPVADKGMKSMPKSNNSKLKAKAPRGR
jgi:hypothetical protein